MNIFSNIAWRNVWLNKRRTIITVAAISFSIAITLLSIALMDGSHDDMLIKAIKVFTGAIQVQHKGFKDDPGLEKSFIVNKSMLKAIKSTKGITGYSPRLQFSALSATTENSQGALVVGANPINEAKVSIVSKKIIKGSYLNGNEPYECIIGNKLAKNLNTKVGSKILLMTQGYDGSLGARKFKISGIFKMGSNEFDRSLVFIRLKEAQELLNAPNRVNTIACMVKSPIKSEKIAFQLYKKIKAINNKNLLVLGWKELLPELIQFVTLDSIFGYLFLAPLFFIVVFGILSTVLASVLERTHEFGIMMALGTKPSQIVIMVMAEALILTTLGLLVGTILGLGISIYFMYNPIYLGEAYEAMTAEYGMDNYMKSAIYPARMGIAIILLVILSITFSLYPAWKASKLKPDKAIRDFLH